MQNPIVTDWKPEHADAYGNAQIQFQHRLSQSELFSKESLAKLIEKYPSHLYTLNTMSSDPMNTNWREGVLPDLPGSQIIDMIENGHCWLNLRYVELVDDRYKDLLNSMYQEFEDRMPGFSTFKRKLGILISSPKAQVFYHADIPGQSLWQIHGQKRVFVYPNATPHLTQEGLEAIFLGETEEDLPYEKWFDDEATVYELEPGQMLHWPLNCPHRIENKGCMNISLTTEHWTSDIRKHFAVNYANGVMRRYFGMGNLSQDTRGMAVYPKAALAMIWRKLNLHKAKKYVSMIDFTLDPKSKSGMVDIPAYPKG